MDTQINYTYGYVDPSALSNNPYPIAGDPPVQFFWDHTHQSVCQPIPVSAEGLARPGTPLASYPGEAVLPMTFSFQEGRPARLLERRLGYRASLLFSLRSVAVPGPTVIGSLEAPPSSNITAPPTPSRRGLMSKPSEQGTKVEPTTTRAPGTWFDLSGQWPDATASGSQEEAPLPVAMGGGFYLPGEWSEVTVTDFHEGYLAQPENMADLSDLPDEATVNGFQTVKAFKYDAEYIAKVRYALENPEVILKAEDIPVGKKCPASFKNEAKTGFELRRGLDGSKTVFVRGRDGVKPNLRLATRDQIWSILCRAHKDATTGRHHGRDQTKALVSDNYHLITKAIIDEFLDACPVCALKRAKLRADASARKAAKQAGEPSQQAKRPAKQTGGSSRPAKRARIM